MTPNKHQAAQNIQFKCIPGTVALFALPSKTSEAHLILEEAEACATICPHLYILLLNTSAVLPTIPAATLQTLSISLMTL